LLVEKSALRNSRIKARRNRWLYTEQAYNFEASWNILTKFFRATCREAGVINVGTTLERPSPEKLEGQKTSKIRRYFLPRRHFAWKYTNEKIKNARILQDICQKEWYFPRFVFLRGGANASFCPVSYTYVKIARDAEGEIVLKCSAKWTTGLRVTSSLPALTVIKFDFARRFQTTQLVNLYRSRNFSVSRYHTSADLGLQVGSVSSPRTALGYGARRGDDVEGESDL